MLVTALNTKIGYYKAAEIANKPIPKGQPSRLRRWQRAI